jgi:hypothetical protein
VTLHGSSRWIFIAQGDCIRWEFVVRFSPEFQHTSYHRRVGSDVKLVIAGDRAAVFRDTIKWTLYFTEIDIGLLMFSMLRTNTWKPT